MFWARLPKYKSYLYDLSERIRIFKRINKGYYSFGLRPGESLIMRYLLIKFGKEGIFQKLKAFWYHEYVKTVEENQEKCSKAEYRLAVKISNIKKLHLEDLLMEISTLKKFAKEVGFGFSDTKGKAEDELIQMIVSKIDKDKKYSTEFVAWYDSLPEDLFKDSSSADDTEIPSQDDLIEAIEDADGEEPIMEILEGFPKIFNTNEYEEIADDLEKIQEKMLADVKKFFTGEAGATDGENVSTSDLLEAINEAADKDALKEIYKEYKSFFPNVSTKGLIKYETLKEKMIADLGTSSEEGEEDIDAIIEKWNAMELPELKAAAKEMGVKVKLGMKKDAIMEAMAEAYESSAGAGSEETAVNPSIINKMIEAKDLEGLNKVASELGITLSLLEKKSPKKAGEKILANITTSKPEAEKTVTKKTEKKSVFSTIAEMVAAKKSDDDIAKAVSPMLKEMGLSDLVIKGKIKTLIEVAKLDK